MRAASSAVTSLTREQEARLRMAAALTARVPMCRFKGGSFPQSLLYETSAQAITDSFQNATTVPCAAFHFAVAKEPSDAVSPPRGLRQHARASGRVRGGTFQK